MARILKIRGKDGNWLGVPALKGSPGVSWVPSVSESGVLSWTNDGGLENPSPVDLKGVSGVWSGSTTPPEGYTVWVDPSGDPTSVLTGATFIPPVDDLGNLSWTNDQGLVNPETKNIKGPEGDPAPQEYVTPEMFGAIGDGVTNDLGAFQTALLQSLPIHLLDKHYKIDGDLFITVHNTCILGKTGGYSNTSPRLSFVNGHGLYINESIYNVRLNGFAIFSDGIGLTMQGENRPGNIIIEDIFFRCKRDVLIDTETGYIYFNKCHFNFNSDTEFDGDLVKIAYSGNGSNRANYIYFNQCAFEGSEISGDGANYLIHLDNCSNISFIQCDMCNCYGVIIFGNIGATQYISLVDNYIWNCRLIANIASTVCFLMTGNAHYTASGTQPLVFPSQRRGHVITGNIFPNWSTVSVENNGTIFANNYIGGTVSEEVLSKLHIGEYTY